MAVFIGGSTSTSLQQSREEDVYGQSVVGNAGVNSILQGLDLVCSKKFHLFFAFTLSVMRMQSNLVNTMVVKNVCYRNYANVLCKIYDSICDTDVFKKRNRLRIVKYWRCTWC